MSDTDDNVTSNSPNFRNAVWESLLNADLNTRYWRELAKRHYQRDRVVKIFLGATTSSTVASWGIWEQADFVWKTCSGLSAILAIALPIMNWPESARAMTDLAARWQGLQWRYNLMWIDLEDSTRAPSEMRSDFETLKNLEEETETAQGALPWISRLVKEIQRTVMASRGLDPPKPQ